MLRNQMVTIGDTDNVTDRHHNLSAGTRDRVKQRLRAATNTSLLLTNLFVALALLEVYAPWNSLPGAMQLGALVDRPFSAATQWVAHHLFKVVGIAATSHPTDARDTALGWITLLVVALVAGIATVVLTRAVKSDDRRTRCEVWLRYYIRFALIAIMLRYSIMKIFPLQMSRPSIAVLNETVGHTSPMTLLWTLIGSSPAYQIMSGALEACCAALLFFRRAALLGAVLGVVVMANVTALNLCFDVPVKLGALLLLLAFLTLIARDVPNLTSFFLRAAYAKAQTQWRPLFTSSRSRAAALVLEATLVAFTLYSIVPFSYASAARESANVAVPSVLSGEWHVDSATRKQGGEDTNAPVLTAEGSPMTVLYLEPDGRAMARSMDGRLWRAGANVDSRQHVLELYSNYFDGLRFQGTFNYLQSDHDHLVLKPENPGDNLSTLHLTRTPLSATYPLLQSRFHWVEEWALER